MKKIKALTAAIFALLFYHSKVSAENSLPLSLNAYAQLSTDYVFRGISYGDDQLSPSLGLTLNHERGFFATFWAGRDDIAGLLGQPQSRDTETEYSLGYQQIFSRNWTAGLKHTWHEFIQQDQPRNHDYQESQLSIHYKDSIAATASYAENIWTTGLDAHHAAVSYRHSVHWPLLRSILLEQELGITRFSSGNSNRASTNLGYLRSSAIKTLDKHWTVQLDYHYSNDSNNSLFNQNRIGSQFVATIGFSI